MRLRLCYLPSVGRRDERGDEALAGLGEDAAGGRQVLPAADS